MKRESPVWTPESDALLDAAVERLRALHLGRTSAAPPPEPSPRADPTGDARTLQPMLRQWLAGVEAMGQLQSALVDAVLAPRAPEDPGAEDTDVLVRLTGLQRALFKHPAAAQALYAALVAEGRAWAETEEGRARWEALATSPKVRQARAAWETTTLNSLDARRVGTLPGVYVDALLAAAGHEDPEALFARLFAVGPTSSPSGESP